ncbi:MAG TPA: peroxiredoxin [Bacteroidota bacterium]|nr:peroxiredoxin [Bacteroidota bacterium]
MKTSLLSTIVLVLCIAGGPLRGGEPKVGEQAPDFTLPFATKDTIVFSGLNLSSEIGKRVIVLAFYPANWSGGCTKEMCTMRDEFGGLAKLNATVYGISGDYVYSHHEWARQLGLPFPLLSDHNHEVARRYQSYNETTGYNRRTVFVIDRQGRIAYMDLEYKVSTPDSFQKLKAALASLQ